MQISNAEWQVMKVVWTKGDITSKEIVQALADKFNWTASTIKTLLGRLVQKDCLTTRKEGNKFFYSPTLSEEDSVDQIVKEVIDKTCEMNIRRVIEQLLVINDFTAKDLTVLSALVEEKKDHSVDQVTCTCM